MCLMISENHLLWCIKLANFKSDWPTEKNYIANKIDNKFGRNGAPILEKLFMCNIHKKDLL